MRLAKAIQKILENGLPITGVKELPNGSGWQVLCGAGIVAVYKSGKCSIQGKFSSSSRKAIQKIIDKDAEKMARQLA